MKFTTYDPATGQITGVMDITDPDILAATQAQNSWISGEWPSDQYYVRDGQAQALPPNPSTDSMFYAFDIQSGQWQLVKDRRADHARMIRAELLSAVDRINPVWYASLTEEQQQQLQAYRQALLDVPQQSGFPVSISWPAKPAWL